MHALQNKLTSPALRLHGSWTTSASCHNPPRSPEDLPFSSALEARLARGRPRSRASEHLGQDQMNLKPCSSEVSSGPTSGCQQGLSCHLLGVDACRRCSIICILSSRFLCCGDKVSGRGRTSKVTYLNRPCCQVGNGKGGSAVRILGETRNARIKGCSLLYRVQHPSSSWKRLVQAH